MRFFSLNLIPYEDRSLCFLDSVPEETRDVRYKMSQGYEMGVAYPSDARVYMSEEYPGFKLASFVGNAQSLLIMSAQVKAVIERFGVPRVEYLPLAIYNHKRKLASSDYFIINPLGTLDCLHLKKSVIKYDGTDVVAVKQMVLDARKVANPPGLFRVKEAPNTYVFSEHLVAELVDIKPTNFYLHELAVSE
ncbi:imm11 family protein [Archangium lansingense]|uniref:Immunity MXAN-0049 protein domain-containing protein n=1 Tax=Archangium lansingense TaxID=2995310 RepID=A0ABT4ACF3_9BACT|nr:DUF1629 domain-containing protein [Archangium lansinium]MCY1078904.1 hypothetical protein [Archangium lansinium]